MSSNNLSAKMSLDDVASQIKGKRVLVRVDFNVPIAGGKVTDATRIKSTFPTLDKIFAQQPAVVILLSHCGRPDGRRQDKYSLKPVAVELEKLYKKKVEFLDDCVGPDVESRCKKMSGEGALILLENLRFHVEEEGKGVDDEGNKIKAGAEDVEKFRASLTSLGDIFVNDAFGTAHRAHSSMVGIKLPTRVAGDLMKKELDYFAKALETPARPFLAILGGAKVADKIQLIENLLDKVDRMIIGGGMAYTFLKQLDNMDIGDSLYDEAGAQKVKNIMEKAKNKNVEIILPIDFKVADAFAEDAKSKIVTKKEGIQKPWQGLDCGPESILRAAEFIKTSKLIVWNGPQGRFEWKQFATGSLEFLNYVIQATEAGATSIVGGGDTASLVENAGKAHQMSHVSTGGGASLELLEGKVLPGVSALADRT